jgi:hypothetical protein
MSRAFDRARFAIVLLALAPVFALPAVGEDFAGWSDNEVNAALANTRLQPPHPQMMRAALTLCPMIVANDTAGAIDCAVNEILGARLPTLAPRDATMLSGLPE